MRNVMRKKSIILLSMISTLLALVIACIVLIRFYPYTSNFPAFPRITRTQARAEGDPVNLVLVGTKEQIASLAHRSYPTAPVSNLYVFGRVQDLAFERPTNDVQNRGHIRLWQTGMLLGGQLVWVGQASYDRGIELSGTNHLPTHHIAPTVDLERNTVGTDLEKTGLVKNEEYAAFTPPIFSARNGGGDYYESDGDVLVINYTTAPIPLYQQAWMIYDLKNGVFSFYDTLFTAPLLALAFGMLGLSAIVVELWLASRWLLNKRGPRGRMTPICSPGYRKNVCSLLYSLYIIV